MADTETARLCVQIIHSHFGPLTAVSAAHFGQSVDQNKIAVSTDCRIHLAHARSPSAGSIGQVYISETPHRTRVYSRTGTAQRAMACADGRRRGGAGGKRGGMSHAIEVWEASLAS